MRNSLEKQGVHINESPIKKTNSLLNQESAKRVQVKAGYRAYYHSLTLSVSNYKSLGDTNPYDVAAFYFAVIYFVGAFYFYLLP